MYYVCIFFRNLFNDYVSFFQDLLDDEDERGGGNAKMARYDSSVSVLE